MGSTRKTSDPCGRVAQLGEECVEVGRLGAGSGDITAPIIRASSRASGRKDADHECKPSTGV